MASSGRKKKKLGNWKKEAWRLTSLYVRIKESIEYNKRMYGEESELWDELGQCVTCGIVKPYKELQAGHFIPQAQGNAVRFDLRNIHTQCYRCNINLGGNGPEYYPYMLGRYGSDVIDELRQLSGTSVKIAASDYEGMIKERKRQLKELTGRSDW